MKLRGHLVVSGCVCLALAGCGTPAVDRVTAADPTVEAGADTLRPAEWAQPLEVEGVPNLHKVTDGLYRSAQPTAQGMQNLKQMGIKTIVNLRSSHSDHDEIGETGLAYEHIRFATWNPEDEYVVRFLQIATDPSRQPVLVHCQHGADRTGTMCALYRVAVQGWDKDAAIKEMVEGGYNFHSIWSNLPRFIENLDIENIQRRAGLVEPAVWP